MILTPDDRKALAMRLFAEPDLFCKTILPHWFTREFSWVHLGILAILTRKTAFLQKYDAKTLDKIERHFRWRDPAASPGDPLSHPIFVREGDGFKLDLPRFCLLMLPRGFAKTTLVNACNLYDVLYENTSFIVYLSETSPHSVMQLANIKRELESNARLLEIFGTRQPELRSGKKWSEDFIETTTEIAIAAKGHGSQVRGLNHGGHRPGKILLDDVEDKESVSTDLQRQKTRGWFYGDVLPAIDEHDSNSTIIAIGTLLHSDALLMTLQNDPAWISIVFGAVDEDGDPIWPEHLDKQALETKKASFARAGELPAFYLEYYNTFRPGEAAKFKRENFIYGKTTEALHKSLVIDPAISDDPGADFCAFGVVGIEKGGIIHVLEATGRVGMSPREQINEYFRLAKLYHPQQYGVEAVAYQTALIHLLREEMYRHGHYFIITPIRHGRQRKVERVEGILQPRYANGYIRHSRVFPELETQLLDWPHGKMDFPDVIAMAVSLLDPYAAQAADPERDLGQDVYPPLEDIFQGEWRIH